MKIASKLDEIQPFHVMDFLAKAQALEREGKSIIHLEVGEPDFDTPQQIVDAGVRALQEGNTRYTPATGLPELKEAISDFYVAKFSVSIDPASIIITPGASGALLLCLSALLNPGDKVLMTDPGYPCNKNFVSMLNAEPVLMPVDAASDFLPSIELLEQYYDSNVKALIVASPSNPTGSVIDETLLSELNQFCVDHDIALIVDEIYQGLGFEAEPVTAANLSDNCFVINSFSKYFCMTGWRLGWVVAPISTVKSLDKIAQNIFLAAPTIAQYAALAAFDDDVIEQLEKQRLLYKQRRDYLYPELEKLGFKLGKQPRGGFYLYADCSTFSNDSYQLTHDLLYKAGVAVTPGIDFGNYKSSTHIRFTYTRDETQLREAVQRLTAFFDLGSDPNVQ